MDSEQPVFGVSTMGEFFDQRAKNMLNMLIRTIAALRQRIRLITRQMQSAIANREFDKARQCSTEG